MPPRTDPINDRGPVPGTLRPRSVPAKRCGNCSDDPIEKTFRQPVTIDPDLFASAMGEKLWQHVCVGTSTCLGMIESYAKLSMPGVNLARLKQMRNRLTNVIHQYEAIPDENPPSVERKTSARENHSEVPECRDDDYPRRLPQ